MDPLAELVAKRAIEDGLYTYCRALDRMDRELALSIWHPDCQIDYGDYFKGNREELLDFIWALHNTLETHAHHVTNKFVEMLSEDRAVAESYTIVFLRARPAPDKWLDQQLSVRYFDRWSLRDGEWKMEYRQGLPDVIYEVERDYRPEFDGLTALSRRDREDPSYDIFETRFR